MDHTRTYVSRRNRELSRRFAAAWEPDLHMAKPPPVRIPGQLELFDSAAGLPEAESSIMDEIMREYRDKLIREYSEHWV
jgi:hypothetical protein